MHGQPVARHSDYNDARDDNLDADDEDGGGDDDRDYDEDGGDDEARQR